MKQKSKLGIFLWGMVLILLTNLTISAQTEKYSIDEAIKRALENNRSIKVSMLEVEKAEEAVDEAFGYALPSLDLEATFSHLIEKPKTVFPDFESLLTAASYGILFDEGLIPYDEAKIPPVESKLQSFAQTNNFETSLQLTQILFNSAVFRGIGASQIYLNLSKEQLRDQIGAVVLDVKRAYNGALLTGELKDITKSSYENALENLSNVKALYEQGLASEYEYLQVKVQVENIKPAIKQLENAFQDAKDGLKILMGLPVDSKIELSGSLDYTPRVGQRVSELVEQGLVGNAQLKVLNTKRLVDEEFIAIDKADYWPTIAAFGNYTYAGSSDDLSFNTYNSTAVGLSFSLNLFKGGRVSSKVQQSKIALKQTDEQLSDLKSALRMQIESKFRELKKVESEIQAMEENVKLAERTYSIAETRYKEGTGTQLEIKNADIELRSAKTNRLQSVHQYNVALDELDNLLGKFGSEYMNFVKIENK
ncbi:MAG: outer membrane channel protein TolC [Melioribacteraceae bacterium]|nr:MAG: outer membrane channel protein TolC [Melioribacteraceae bacterium]